MKIPDELKVDTPTARGVGLGDVLQEQFELLRVLGSGGMGCVYEARDLHLERRVAVKVLPAFLGSSRRAAEALRKEAARAIELEHSSIGRVYQFGLHLGQPFLVMHLVDGYDLAEHLHGRGRLPVGEALALLAPLADALDYAHGRGVVHRDVKPSNILLHRDGTHPVLIDFGIAGEVRAETTRSGAKRDSDTAGTLSYMSPEQVRGEPPHPSMDMYSLAAVAYEMLAGEPPFFRGDPMNVQYQILNEPPRAVPQLEAAVSAMLVRGLAKRAPDRFASARELVDAMGGRPVAAPAPPPSPPAPAAGPATECTADPACDSPVPLSLAARKPWLFAALGLVDGIVSAIMGGGLWNLLAVPRIYAALPASLQVAWWPLALLHFLPPAFVFIPVLAMGMAFAGEFIERRIPGVARPIVLGSACGTPIGAFLLALCAGPTLERVSILLAGLSGIPTLGLVGIYFIRPQGAAGSASASTQAA